MPRPAIKIRNVDLFAHRDPVPEQTILIPLRFICKVCQMPARVTQDWPALLCPLCMENLDATATHVQHGIDAVLNCWDALNAQWEATVTHSPARERWAKVEAAIIEHGMQDATVRRVWQQRKAEGGPFAALLTAYEAYDRDNAQLAHELAALTAARKEINHAVLNAPLTHTEKAA